MRLILHPKVFSDIDAIMTYYQKIGSPELANGFRTEFTSALATVAADPKAYATRQGGLRRFNLRRFPYHFLFWIEGETVRILVVRHHRRRPSWGTERT